MTKALRPCNVCCMSEMPTEVHIPDWDVADRLRKSLRDIGMGVQEMADYQGVSRNTVSNWLNGHNDIGRPAMRLWAMRTGVPLEWIKNGTPPADGTTYQGTTHEWDADRDLIAA